MIARRTFIKGAVARRARNRLRHPAGPRAGGVELLGYRAPKLKAPANACDCHMSTSTIRRAFRCRRASAYRRRTPPSRIVVELADIFRRLPTQMVFDHLGNPTLPAGIDHASHAILRDLVDKGRTWVKLSGAYSNSKAPRPTRKRRAPRAPGSPRRRTCSRCGRRTRRRATASSSPIRKRFTGSGRDRPEDKLVEVASEAFVRLRGFA